MSNDENKMIGYYWAYEDLPKEDADWVLVFVEVDGSVWYGRTQFKKEDFKHWIKFFPERPDYYD